MDSGRRAGCVSDPTGLVQKLAFPFNLSTRMMMMMITKCLDVPFMCLYIYSEKKPSKSKANKANVL